MGARSPQIVLDAANLKKAMRHLAKVDPDFARAIKEVGHPELRLVPSGFGGLMRSIVGQQVSVHAARSIWLDSGDAFQGAPVFNMFKGEAEMRALSVMGLDGAVVGNHEFDLGAKNLFYQIDN